MHLAADDLRAITALGARFAQILDLRDYDGLRDVLAADVHYVSVGREFHDIEAVIADFRARTGDRVTRHTLGNAVISLSGPRRATGWSVWSTFAGDGTGSTPPRVFMVADFMDVYVRLDSGAWRIAERIITPIFRDDALAPGARASPTT
jgi:hypothetical protein